MGFFFVFALLFKINLFGFLAKNVRNLFFVFFFGFLSKFCGNWRVVFFLIYFSLFVIFFHCRFGLAFTCSNVYRYF